MFILNNIQYNYSSVFENPVNIINKNTIFPTSEELKKLQLNSPVQYTDKPVDVEVNEQTSLVSREINSVNNNISDSLVRVGVTQSWIEKVLSIVGDIKDMAEDAADTHPGDYDRNSVNTDAQNLLSLIDEYYLNAEFNGKKLLQGNVNYVTINNGEDEFPIHDANISRSYLGIDSIDLSTQDSANTAVTALEKAEKMLQGQLAVAENEAQMLLSVYSANTQTLNAYQTSVESQYSYNQAITLLENVKSAMTKQLNIGIVYTDGKIRDKHFENILQSMKKLQEKIDKSDTKDENTDSQGETPQTTETSSQKM